MQDIEKIRKKYQGITFLALLTLIVGTVFYHYVERFSWIDALYFCVITLTTIGYGDIAPKTDVGKLFTILYVLVGVGIIAAFAHTLLERAADRRAGKQKNNKKYKTG
jgi:hypothetical protein